MTSNRIKSKKDAELQVIKGEIPEFPYQKSSDILDRAHTLTSELVFGSNRSILNAVRMIGNPYGQLGTIIFMNRAGPKLAEIDKEYRFFGREWNMNTHNASDEIRVMDLAGGPGGFVQYVQYRFPKSFIVGVSLSDNDSFNWNVKEFTYPARFKAYDGPKKAGDLIADIRYYSDSSTDPDADVLFQEKFDFVTADGEAGRDEISSSSDEESYGQHRMLRIRLLAAEILSGLNALKNGGNFTVKIFTPEAPYIQGFLSILLRYFKNVYVFKPETSRTDSSEHFIVCMNKTQSLDKKDRRILLRVVTEKSTYIVSTVRGVPEYEKVNVVVAQQKIEFIERYGLSRPLTMSQLLTQLNLIKDLPEVTSDHLKLHRFVQSLHLPTD